MSRFSTGVGLAILLATLRVVAADVTFSTKPSAVKAGTGVKITFAVSAPTDVEVAILDATNGVVRHLAAGVLGAKNPPPEPLQPGLAQELVWDGKDDFGRAAGGASKIRVRAGTGVKFGRFVGNSPYLTSVQAVACDEEGNVYIQYNPGSPHIRVFDPDGRYLREVLPFPADLPPEAMKNVAAWDAQAQAFRPKNTAALWPALYSMGAARMVCASLRTGVLLASHDRLYRLDSRGGVVGKSFESHHLWGGVKRPGFPYAGEGRVGVWAALSPDGKYAYLSGPFSRKTASTPLYPDVPPGRVYRVALDGQDTWKEFVTVKGAWDKDGMGGNYQKNMGLWTEYFGPRSAVQGVAVDAKGRVFVCDRENGRVVAFDESGKEIDEIAVPFAEQVAVHPQTGAIYVMQKDRTTPEAFHAMLFKFDKLGKDVKPSATYTFSKKTSRPQMALSAGKDRTRVWIAGVPEGLVALDDKGTSFEPAKTSYQPPADLAANWVRFAVDAGRDEVYSEDAAGVVHRWDGKTGEGGMLLKNGKPFNATDLSVGYDGLLYLQTGKAYSGPLGRYTRDLEPAPYPTGTHILNPYVYCRYGHALNCEKGFGVGPRGEVYVSFMYNWARYMVGGFGPDGKPLNGLYMKGKVDADNFKRGQPKELDSAIIGPVPDASGGVRVDLAGNIYIGVDVLSEDYARPAGYDKEPANAMIGSVIRFGPRGGGFLAAELKDGESKQPDAPRITVKKFFTAPPRKMVVEGATKAYAGLAPFSGLWESTSDCCVCRVPRFDLDRYGRLYLPNAIANSVRIVDNNDNLIVEFGRYGNFDSQYVNPNTEAGPSTGSTGSPQTGSTGSPQAGSTGSPQAGAGHGKPTVAIPEIPLAWPTGVGVSEAHVYVNDSYNNRAVRVGFTWKAEETVSLK